MDYEKATIEELEAEIQRLSSERAELREEQLAVAAVMDQKIHLRDAAAQVAALSDEQVAALTQVIQARHADLMLAAKEAE